MRTGTAAMLCWTRGTTTRGAARKDVLWTAGRAAAEAARTAERSIAVRNMAAAVIVTRGRWPESGRRGQLTLRGAETIESGRARRVEQARREGLVVIVVVVVVEMGGLRG